jgi:hypothetical protein
MRRLGCSRFVPKSEQFIFEFLRIIAFDFKLVFGKFNFTEVDDPIRPVDYEINLRSWLTELAAPRIDISSDAADAES